MNDFEDLTTDTAIPVCPYCGEEQDNFEHCYIGDSEDNIEECVHCGKEFLLDIYQEPRYYASKKEINL